ncbi:hypothetical protein IFM89_016939 [Coptis chinensis]|uniref:Pentatricopeptide repeat-containing protein n=1 Tax=Coptis chinensis TaxID=261450 RepID=A0A835H6Q7_9MAGN|nr:hypothetical protein IFM89_016939 [Coptis chinensis]
MYAKCGAIEDFRKVFDDMPKRDLVTWTVIIYAYADSGNPNKAMLLYDSMMNTCIVLDKVAMVTIAYACAKLGSMHEARLVGLDLKEQVPINKQDPNPQECESQTPNAPFECQAPNAPLCL